MHIVVAANPAAGSGRGVAVGGRAASRLRRAGHRVTELEQPSSAALTRALKQALDAGDVDAVVVVGGDGMVHLAVQLLAGTPVPLGIVPTGTGNDIARSLGLLEKDSDVAIGRVLDALSRESRVLDAVRLDGAGDEHRWFAGVLSAGFDAAVNERGNRLRYPRGASRYIVALILELAALRPIRYRLGLDDGPATDVDAVLITVGNTTSIGGGMRMTPDALPDDGLLDVLVASPLSRFNLVRIFPRVFAGTHTGDRHVTISRAQRVTIDADGPADSKPVAFADGERLGPLPLTIECVPGALRLLA